MITYEWLYVLAGAAFAVWAALSAKDRRWGNAAFWALLAVSFLAGSHLSDLANGMLVLALVAIAGLGGLKRSDDTDAEQNQRLAPGLEQPGLAQRGVIVEQRPRHRRQRYHQRR